MAYKNKNRKKKIPCSLRQAVWVKYNGKKYENKCHVKWCKNKINVFNFEAGHDVPESLGGQTCIENLKPICCNCNKSMGNKFSITDYNNIFASKVGLWGNVKRYLHMIL